MVESIKDDEFFDINFVEINKDDIDPKLIKTRILDLDIDLEIRPRTIYKIEDLTVNDILNSTKKQFRCNNMRVFSPHTLAILLNHLDRLGVRAADCSRTLYPDIESYFNDLFVCDICGKHLNYTKYPDYESWKCAECQIEDNKKINRMFYVEQQVSLNCNFSTQNDTILFSISIQNNTKKPIRIFVNDINLYHNQSLWHSRINSNYPEFVEDYIFPRTGRLIERMWSIPNPRLQNGDYFTVYLSDTTNSKKFFFKYLVKENSLIFDDCYEYDQSRLIEHDDYDKLSPEKILYKLLKVDYPPI